MLAYVGSYDFGGLTTIREITAPALAGLLGFLFVFVLRQRVTREDGDECLFQFAPVFVTADGQIDEPALTWAVTQTATDVPTSVTLPPDPTGAFHAAKQHLEQTAALWDWANDVEFLGLSWVEFK